MRLQTRKKTLIIDQVYLFSMQIMLHTILHSLQLIAPFSPLSSELSYNFEVFIWSKGVTATFVGKTRKLLKIVGRLILGKLQWKLP